LGAQSESVWILLGDHGNWPSGVFSSRVAAVQWIAGHYLTGMITEYPLDAGVYDWAVATGSFRPVRPEHSSCEFIGRFTASAQEHEHFTDSIRD
jgi:hypothetical protein